MDLKLKDNSNFKLPYIELDYIEATGSQYIDIGVKPKKSIGIYADFQYTAATASQYLFGHTYASGTSGISYAFCINGNSVFATAYNNGQGNWTALGVSANTNRHTLEFNVNNDKAIKIDGGDTYSGTITGNPTNTSTDTLIVFAQKNKVSGTVGSYSKVKLYRLKAYDDGVLIKDFVPAIDIEDCSIGLYDIIGKVFHKNEKPTALGMGNIINTDLSNFVESAFISNCPEINARTLLKFYPNLSRIRCNLGEVFATRDEAFSYTLKNGFNDLGEFQTKPRIVGTYNISSYYANNELDYLQSAIDGLTISGDASKNIDDLLDNDGFKIQVLDNTKPNYNPAACILLCSLGYTGKVHFPIVEGGGLFGFPKAVSSSPTTNFRGITTLVDTEGIVSSDTTAEYDFDNFEEFQYFNNTSITAGSSTSVLGAFGNCTKLKKIILPPTVTSIGEYAFYNCTALEDITIPTGVTSIGKYAFYNCTSIKNLYIPCSVTNYVFRGTSAGGSYTIGDGTGELIIKGDLTCGGAYNNQKTTFNFTKILVYGTLYGNTISGASSYFITSNGIVRCKEAFRISTSYASSYMLTGNKPFFEAMGNITAYGNNSRLTGSTIDVVHLNNTAVITATPTQINIAKITTIYVGNGISKQDDVDVLDLYLANTNWSAYSAKFDTWWDYNGTYKWYRVTDTLTNCTNTNPVVWPFITRKDSYETTIVADEGYTLDSVQVLMYECADDTATPAIPTDVTSSVYDSSTGVISIEHVIGNVEIIASATANS